jgi:hypothetical protein
MSTIFCVAVSGPYAPEKKKGDAKRKGETWSGGLRATVEWARQWERRNGKRESEGRNVTVQTTSSSHPRTRLALQTVLAAQLWITTHHNPTTTAAELGAWQDTETENII